MKTNEDNLNVSHLLERYYQCTKLERSNRTNHDFSTLDVQVSRYHQKYDFNRVLCKSSEDEQFIISSQYESNFHFFAVQDPRHGGLETSRYLVGLD